MHKISATILTLVASGLLVSGCSAVDQAADDASNAVKDAGNNATDAAKAQATEAVKNEASKALEGGIKIDPNDITESQIAMGLRLAGVENADTLAKELKDNGPYTKENLEPKVRESLEGTGVSDEEIEKLLGMLEIPEDSAGN